jgi:hypothetical protein
VSQIDNFAQALLEESKRFLERAQSEESAEGASAYLHASLMLAFSSLEAHVNSISDDFVNRPEITVHDKAILLEREVRLEKGQFALSNTLKMVRLEDRIQFLHARFSGKTLQGQIEWWSRLSDATKLRNQLTHPKEMVLIKTDTVERAIQAIIDTIDALYQVIYKLPFPAAARGIKSMLNF